MRSLSAVLQDGYRYNTPHQSSSSSLSSKVDIPVPANCRPPPSLASLMATKLPETSETPYISIVSKTYFDSPIRTLCESIKDPGQFCISIHDLLEAYNILSTRIRLMLNAYPSIIISPAPCLAVFAEYSSEIAHCVSRDVQRLLPSPFDSEPQQDSSGYQSYDFDLASNFEDAQMMVDSVSLCHYALRFASDMFAFSMLYSNFSDASLVSLLRDILSLCSTTHPLLANLDKARSMVVWILKIQQLPTSIFLHLELEVLSTLRYGLSAPSETSRTKLDALTAIYTLTKEHPILVDSLVELLDPVLNLLVADSLDLRINASLALCGFAIAKLKSEDGSLYPRSRTTAIACAYIDRETKRSELLDADKRLPNILKAGLAGEGFWENYGPSFSLVVTSSFLVLIDRFIWETPRSLKLLVNTIALFAGHKRSNVRHAHPQLWRILIWAFSRLPPGNEPSNSQENVNVDTSRSTRERAYNFLLQERRDGLLTDVVNILLRPANGEPRSPADVKKALGLVQDMISSNDAASRDDGIKLLGRILVDIGRTSFSEEHDQQPRTLFSWSLVDGSVANRKVKEVLVRPFKLDFQEIPPLSEEEVIAHWQYLSQSWTEAVHKYLESNQDISASLLGAWQTLLLVRGEVVHGHHHFTASPSVAASVADILNGLSSPIDTPDSQARCLTFLTKLWGVLKNVFTREWLSAPAQIVLTAFLEKPFVVSDERVGGVWARVCEELVAVGIPTLLHDLDARAENRAGLNVTRQLWLVVARTEHFGGEDANWKDILHLLSVPIGAWDMSPAEFEFWAGMLDTAIEVGQKGHQSQQVVLFHFFQVLKDSKFNSLKSDLRTLHCLLSRSLPAFPSQVDPRLLSLIDEGLRGCYHTMVKDDEKQEHVLRLLRSLGEVLSATTPAEIVGFLSTMQGSLACWIADEREVLQNELHDEMMSSLYKRSLELLSEVEPSIPTLTNIADFVQCVFVHIRGDGVLAFNAFWRSTYHPRKDIPKDAYPAPIKACLKAWSDFCDDSLADDLSDSQSQSQSVDDSTIPDSQLAQSISLGDEGYILEYEAMFAAEIAAAATSRCTTTTPTPRNVSLPPGSTPTYASPLKEGDITQTFQNRGSRYDASDAENQDSQPSLSNEVGAASSSKRPSRDPETPPSAKRCRIDISRGREPSSSHKSAASMLLSSVSEPVSRTSSPHPRPSASQPSRSHRALERSVMGLWFGSGIHQSERRSTIDRDEDNDEGSRGFLRSSPEMRPSDDYDTWEQGISAEDIREVQAEGEERSDFFVPDSEENPNPGEEKEETEPGATSPDQCDSDSEVLESLSLGQYPARPRMRHRSQTAPAPIPDSPPHSHRPLRRQQTSPGPGPGNARRTALAAPLDALRDAYAALAEADGVSQVDVDEILQARRLANQISEALDEKICAKVAASRARTPGK